MRQIAILDQRGISRHSHFAGTAAQSRPLDAQLALPQGDHAILCAVPTDLTRLSAGMLGAGHRLGGQNQELLDELARELTQQVIDGQLGLTDHR